MTDLLFDSPWWITVGVALAGVALFAAGNRRQEKRLQAAGLAVAAAGVLLLALSYFVKTDVERALDGSGRLVDAVVARDWKTFESLLDPRSGFVIYDRREQIVEGAKQAVERVGLKSANVTHKEARREKGQIIVALSVISEQDESPYPIPSDWEFEWEQSGDGQWLVRRIRPLRVHNAGPDAVVKRLPNLKGGNR